MDAPRYYYEAVACEPKFQKQLIEVYAEAVRDEEDKVA